jgi:hypothetical protein
VVAVAVVAGGGALAAPVVPVVAGAHLVGGGRKIREAKPNPRRGADPSMRSGVWRCDLGCRLADLLESLS